MADQQYCLRWNNHQPTLAGSFDRMLKDDRFTDCTLSAEGVNVEAHRMLLCACSPYFDALFKQYKKERFPIVIIRDVSVVELKALMDYMYRGEVNISQDQLAGLLKVAELLQIKGLYEAGFSESRASAPAPAAPRVSTGSAIARPQPLDLPPDITSDGAASPAPKRRKRARRRSSSDDFPTTIDVAAEPIGQAVAPPTTQSEPVNNILSDSVLPVPPKLEEHQFDVVLPKEEYVDDQDSIENITLDDDDMDEMDQAGPSHGDGSSQGYPPSWHQSDRSTDDLFLSAQDSINNAGGAQRDSQGAGSVLIPLSRDFGEETVTKPIQYNEDEDPLPLSTILVEGEGQVIFAPFTSTNGDVNGDYDEYLEDSAVEEDYDKTAAEGLSNGIADSHSKDSGKSYLKCKCGNFYRHKSSLNRHKEKCRGKSFSSVKKIPRPFGEGDFECLQCGNRYSRIDSLNLHIRQHHRDADL